MIEVAQIGMKLAVVDGASAVLSSIAAQMLKMEMYQGRIQKGFEAWKPAIMGVAAIFTGGAILSGLKNMADHGDKLLDQQFKMRNLGIQQNEILKLQAQYYSQVARSVPTASLDEYLKTVRELRAITGGGAAGLAAAANMAPQAMMMNELLGNEMGTKAGDEYYKLLRSAEMKGIATNPEKRQAFINEAYKYIAGFGGKLTANDFQLLARRGGLAWMNAKPESLGPLAVLSADIGGSGAGVTAMTLQQFQMGSSVLSKQQGAVLEQLGLLDMSKVTKTGFGGGKLNVGLGGIRGSLEYSGDLPGWIQQVVYPAIVKAAGGDEAKIQALISKIAPNRNASRLIQMFGDEGFRDQIAKDMGIAGGVLRLEKGYGDYVANNPVGVKKAFGEQYKSMMESIGAPMMQAAIPVMKAVTSLFTTIGEFANKHPESIKVLATGLAGLGAALIGAGGLAILAAIGPAGWIIGGITALGATFSQFPKEGSEIIKTCVDWLKKAVEGIESFSNAIGRFVLDLMGKVGSLFGLSGGGNTFADSKRRMMGMGANVGGASGAWWTADRQSYALNRLKSEGGLSDEGAKALVSTWAGIEAPGGPGSSNNAGGGHWGIAQWGLGRGGRGAAYMGYEDQITKAIHELHTSEGHAASLLRSTDPATAAHGAAQFERGGYGASAVMRAVSRNRALHGVSAPPKSDKQVQVHTILNVDGRQIAQAVTRHVVRMAEHTRQAPFHNGQGMFTGPDAQFAVG